MRTRLFIGLIAALAMRVGAPLQATEVDLAGRGSPLPLAIGHQSFQVVERSIKCDLRHLDGISILRLADCYSARLLTLVGQPGINLFRFEIRPTDGMISEGTRAELGDLYEATNGEETWYRILTALPSDFPVERRHSLVLSQWHEHARAGGDSFRPPLAHRLVNGTFVVALWNQKIFDENGSGDGLTIFRDPNFKLGVFYEFVYRIVWNPDLHGLVAGWRRERCLLIDDRCPAQPWQKFVDYHGPIGYPSVLGYYFKFGVYTTHTFEMPYVAYHTGFARGPSAASVGATEDIFKE